MTMNMKPQIKSNSPLKIYPKVNDDVCPIEPWSKTRESMDSLDGSLDELILKFRKFLKEGDVTLFDLVVREVWLEQQITINGVRRVQRKANGNFKDLSFSRFMRIGVGMTNRVITSWFCFTRIATYLIDLFPEFLFDDPFKSPEKYEYPYKNVSLGHMVFVYQMHNRLKMLEEAERRAMSYAEFTNWAHNWALCYNEDTGNDGMYQLNGGYTHWPYIRNNKLKPLWENKKFNFNVKK